MGESLIRTAKEIQETIEKGIVPEWFFRIKVSFWQKGMELVKLLGK